MTHHSYCSPSLRRLLLGLLGLEVVVDTVGNGTTDQDDTVETDAEATGGSCGGAGGGRGLGLALGVTGLEGVSQSIRR